MPSTTGHDVCRLSRLVSNGSHQCSKRTRTFGLSHRVFFVSSCLSDRSLSARFLDQMYEWGSLCPNLPSTLKSKLFPRSSSSFSHSPTYVPQTCHKQVGPKVSGFFKPCEYLSQAASSGKKLSQGISPPSKM